MVSNVVNLTITLQRWPGYWDTKAVPTSTTIVITSFGGMELVGLAAHSKRWGADLESRK